MYTFVNQHLIGWNKVFSSSSSVSPDKCQDLLYLFWTAGGTIYTLFNWSMSFMKQCKHMTGRFNVPE